MHAAEFGVAGGDAEVAAERAVQPQCLFYERLDLVGVGAEPVGQVLVVGEGAGGGAQQAGRRLAAGGDLSRSGRRRSTANVFATVR
ncbi:hypothetical protein [Actinomadura sp. NPDC048394]|uniref:hypothetical protein n=1 Tax=Actinomadura sp. NPDC048394 TaxID=3158223 RepID=UPI0033E0E7BE